MSRVTHLPAGGVVLAADDARAVATTILAAQDLATRHGARLKSRVLLIAAELSSTTGETEPTAPLVEHTVEYEQIDADTTADLLGCSARNVRDMAARGRLPAVKQGGRWWFNRDDIEVHRDWR